MKIKFLITLIISFIILNSCNNNTNNSTEEADTTDLVQERYHNNKTYYAPQTKEDNLIVLTDTIIYEVIVKKNIENEHWTISNPQKFDTEAFTNIIFNAIYNKRLTPYNFINGDIVPIKEIKQYEKELRNSTLGKIQFMEEWYFDEIKLQMYKKINAVTIGYELYNDSNEINGYKALFTVYLDNNEKLKIEN